MPVSENTDQVAEGETQVYAATNTTQSLKRLADAGVPQLSNGSITGIAALF